MKTKSDVLMNKTTAKNKDQRAGRLKTVRDVFRYAVSQFNQAQLFFGHGSDNAYDEAAYLILKTLALPLDVLDVFLDSVLLKDEVKRLLDLIDQRTQQRIPIAYLTQEAFLGDYRFYVDERVIVPRSFIAELLRNALSPWVSEPSAVRQVLELCTGSGCLSIIAADCFPHAQIDAVDISADALAVAHQNVADYHLQERVRLIESDLFDKVPRKKYDLIIANPPYVNAQSMQTLPIEYQHEPILALAGGTDGMDIVRKIVAQAKTRLNKKGILIIEIGNERGHVEAAFPDLPITWLSTSAGDDMVFLVQAADL